VPGAAPQRSGSPTPTPEEREKKNKKKKDKKKENVKDRAAQDTITNGEAASAPKPQAIDSALAQAELLGGDDGSVPPTPGGELSLDPLAKKIRNLNKKVSFADPSVQIFAQV
jgi:translation initiation factor 2A